MHADPLVWMSTLHLEGKGAQPATALREELTTLFEWGEGTC